MTEFREEQIGDVRAVHGDCLAVLPTLDAESIDTVITDPPYGLAFMGALWDHGIPGIPFWTEALRVAKPGAFLLAFGGTRTFHRLGCAIEDAGWEIRDTIMWVYGQGFPKSMDISKAIDKEAGLERKQVPATGGLHNNRNLNDDGWNKIGDQAATMSDRNAICAAAAAFNGWGTALKPAYEPILVCMKPLDGTFANNAIKHGVAGLNIDAWRVPANGDSLGGGNNLDHVSRDGKHEGWKRPWMNDASAAAASAKRSRESTARSEQIGRFPANLIHDGSDEVVSRFPSTSRASGSVRGDEPSSCIANSYSDRSRVPFASHGDFGSASRFFYCAKASSAERGEGNIHPTVKPLALMEYLCKLTSTPTGGKVLDMFGGSFSTAVACVNTGRPCVIIEREDTEEQPFFTIGCGRVSAAIDIRNIPKPPSLFDDDIDDTPELVATGPIQNSLFDE